MSDYSVSATLSAKDTNFSSTFNNAAKVASNATKGISGVTKTIGNSMIGAGVAVTAMGVKAATGFGSFQSSLNQAAVIAGGTSKDIQGLSDVANKMGADLPLSAKDAADAMVSMARDGASIKDIKKEFPAIAQAATAAGADLNATASVVQQSMNIWGKSIGTPQQAAADLVTTANLSNASIESMQQGLATIGPTASSAGYSMQDMSTALGLLTNKGQSTAQASQDLNHAILALQAPSKITAGELKRLGVSVTDSQGNMKSFPTLLQDISKSMDGMTNNEKQQALKKLVGTAGMQAMGPLLQSISDKSGDAKTSWSAFSSELQKSTSSVDAANKSLSSQASEMQKNVGSKIEQVGGNWESFSNKAMASKSKVTGGMLDMISGTLDWASKSDSGVAKVARSFMGLSPIIGPALTGIGTMIRSVAPIGKLLGGIGKFALGSVKGIVQMIGKLFGLGASGAVAGAGGETAAVGEKAAGNAAKTSAKDLIAMGLSFLEIAAGIALVVGSFALLVFAITGLAKTGSKGVIAMIAFGATIAVLAGVFALLGGPLTAGAVGIAAFGVAILAIGVGVAIAAAGIALLVVAATGLINAFISLTAVSKSIIPTFSALGVGFAQMIVGFVSTIATNMPIIINTFILGLQQMIVQGMTLIPLLVQFGMNMILGLLQGIANNIQQLVTVSIQIIVNFINGLSQGLPKLIVAGANFIINILNGISQQLPGIITAAVNVIVSFINGIAKNLGKIINAGVNLLGKFITGVVNAIPKLANIAVQAVEKFVYGVGYALGKVASSGTKLIGMFVKGIISGITGSRNAGKSNGDAVSSVLKGINLFSVGKNIIQGLINGIGSMVSAAAKKVGEVANGIKNKITGFFKIHSPSRVMFGVGGYVSEGLINGIASMQKRAEKAALNLANSAMPNMNFSAVNDQLNNLRSNFSSVADMTSNKLNGSINVKYEMSENSMQMQSNELLKKIANKNTDMYLDRDIWVGSTREKFNQQLGDIVSNEGRWTFG